MPFAELRLRRAEGGVLLEQETDGTIRLTAAPPRKFESLLTGRAPQDAILLTQQISGDSSVSHALAAALAWESVTGGRVAGNGVLLRDVLHLLSFVHAHLRQFYLQSLPDYLPPQEYSRYAGADPALKVRAAGFSGKAKRSWSKFRFCHAFTREEADRLMENQARAVQAMDRLQRMMAALGGKFPVVMSIVPGGFTVPVTEPLVLKLRAYLREIAPFLRGVPFQDAKLVVRRYPDLKTMGNGIPDFLSAGTMGDESGPGASHYPAGVLVGRRLEPLQERMTESLHRAFYRIAPPRTGAPNAVLEAPDKPGAYSWIKAPRYAGGAMETGSIARLAIIQISGSRGHSAATLTDLDESLADFPFGAVTVAGRMLARLGELPALVRRLEETLEQLLPGHPTVAAEKPDPEAGGEGIASIEAPAGLLHHRIAVEKRRVVQYDIVTPSTWNGASSDEKEIPGPLEKALNRDYLDLRTAEDGRDASRIVHSFAFSATDAVQ